VTRFEFIALVTSDVETARRIVANRILTESLERLVPRLLERWDLGDMRYGPLILDDGRRWAKESVEEGDDAVTYELFQIAQKRGIK
jgi:hypothetical protein